MTARHYSTLAATIFALLALVQLARAMMGWPIVFFGHDIPLWPNWLAFVFMSTLSVVGFHAAREG